jgi:hypothetical protein
MSIKRSLLLSIATVALAMTALAPSAMGATDGVLRDVNSPNGIIPAGTNLHFVGWTRIQTSGSGMMCHVTAQVEATGSTGTTGDINSFVIATSTCEGFGVAFANCTITADSVNNLPYHVTVTPTDFDVTGNIEITTSIGATPTKTCNFTFTNMFFEEITLVPLNTTNKRTVTNTSNNLGNVAAAGEAISGVRIEGEGEAENNTLIPFPVALEGELELTTAERCTYKIAAS